MKKFSQALAALLFVVRSMASGMPGEPPKWKEEWQKTIEAAKKDGQLSLYGGQEITHPDILAAFNKEFPFIKVVTVRSWGRSDGAHYRRKTR